jgi:hypothetical protein
MASNFNVEFSVPDDPAGAQARGADALTEPARAVGLRLTKRSAGELQYRPQVQWPFLIVLCRNLNGENMSVCFQPGDAGGTRVTISGGVARSKHSLAADPEHWTAALGVLAGAAR